MSAVRTSRYIPSRIDGVENVEGYVSGGYHPISIGDVLANGRYRVVHKLGFGGFSTVWLARDGGHRTNNLVTLKVLRADASSRQIDQIPDVSIPKLLQSTLPPSVPIQFIDDHFTIDGPNGFHLCLVSPLLGPSVLAMSDSPGRMSGSRRLRGDLARSVAKQTATALYLLHREGVVHGDLTTSNILFRLSPEITEWSDALLYATLESPETEDVRTRNGEPLDPHAPTALVAPIDHYKLANASFLEESVVVTDFGQSYFAPSPPAGYQPGTAINYLPPETRFEGRTGPEADVWALGCAIFEIRAGFPLFESFLGSDVDILRQTVEVLGRLPDPWWGLFEQRSGWFEENGEPKDLEAQERAGVFIRASRRSIREKVRSIGILPADEHNASYIDDGPMMERPGATLDEGEIELLSDLLEGMLRYRPDDRMRAHDILHHPWFTG